MINTKRKTALITTAKISAWIGDVNMSLKLRNTIANDNNLSNEPEHDVKLHKTTKSGNENAPMPTISWRKIVCM